MTILRIGSQRSACLCRLPGGGEPGWHHAADELQGKSAGQRPNGPHVPQARDRSGVRSSRPRPRRSTRDLFAYSERFYRRKRLYSALGYLPRSKLRIWRPASREPCRKAGKITSALPGDHKQRCIPHDVQASARLMLHQSTMPCGQFGRARQHVQVAKYPGNKPCKVVFGSDMNC